MKKHWYYIASDEPNRKCYFDSYDYTQFAIVCIFRYKAVTNEVPDYAIYHDGDLVENVSGEMLFQMYVDNGGEVFEECLNKNKKDTAVNERINTNTIANNSNSQKESMSPLQELSNVIAETNKALQELTNDINKLHVVIGGKNNEG